MNDYEKDIEIDPNSLDVNWLDQAPKFWKYAKLSAEIRKRVDLAKEHLDVVRAEVDREIRSDPKLFEIDKITEAVVQNTILVTNKYKNANTAYIDAKYEFEISRAAVQAMEQRKDALENLVKLHGMSYFAGPSVPRDLSKEWEQKRKDSNSEAEIASAMRLKRVRKNAETSE